MDGNGRWALQQGLSRVEGHRKGVDAVRLTVHACLEKKIPYLSLFAFSSENWARPPEEVNYLMQLFMDSIEKEMTHLHERGVRVRFLGERSKLSALLQACMESIETLTANNTNLTLNLALNYGGRWDILETTKILARRVAEEGLSLDAIDESLFSSMLSTDRMPDPDLLIRTSGELRISNFFLWQAAYSELYFTEVHWPDFTLDDFEKALTCFAARFRRYGKTSAQVDNHHV